MGQQQLLIALLGIAVVGIAIFVGITLFKGSSEEETRNLIIHDLSGLALKAREYYWKPRFLGGGDKSFQNITMGNLTSASENDVARYYVESATPGVLILAGVGKQLSGEDSVRVRMRIDAAKKKPEILQ
jgi:hypothetical protein